MAAEEKHEGEQSGYGNGRCGQEVCECRLAAFLRYRCAVFRVVVFGQVGDGEHGDDLRDARQYARDGLTRHDGLGVFADAVAGDVGEDAVLAETGGEAGAEDDGHEEAEVGGRAGVAEEEGREGEEGEAYAVEDEGEDDARRVVGAALEFGEEEHGEEVCDCGDGDEGWGEGGEEGVGGAEAVLEVGGGGEEHVPIWMLGLDWVGWSSRVGKGGGAHHAQSMETPRRRNM